MTNIVWLRGNQHDQVQAILPWYLTGRLDEADREMVESHLEMCRACCEDLDAEREMAALVREISFTPDRATPRRRAASTTARRRSRRGQPIFGARRAIARPSKLRWVLIAQGIAIALLATIALPGLRPADYHTLSAPAGRPQGNVIAIFAPSTSERDLRATLDANQARLVDGPTVSGAYVLRVPEGKRDAILSRLRLNRNIVLAQPIDGGGQR